MPDTPTPDFASNAQIMQRLLMQRAAEKARAATWADAAQYAPESIESQVERERVRRQKWETAAQESIKETWKNIPSAEAAAEKQRSVDAAYKQMSDANARYQAEQLEQIRQSQSTSSASNARPSSASPPPTPRTSGGAGNVVDMMHLPPTAAPRQPLAGPNPSPGAKPSGLPGAPGRLAYPAAGAAIDFAFRLGSGQPLGGAAAGAAGSGIGSALGFGAGSALGPMGAFAGGMVGGYLGGMAGSALYDLAFPPTAEAPQDLSDPKTGPRPFEGGQCPISYGFVYTNTTGNPVRTKDQGIRVIGPIKSITTAVQSTGFSAPSDKAYYVIVQAEEGISMENIGPKTWRHSMGYTAYGAAKFQGIEAYNPNNSFDSPLDNCGSPPPGPIPQDKRAPDSLGHPGNTNFAPPSATPPISIGGEPNPFSSSAPPTVAPNPAPNNYPPGGLKNKSGGNPRGDSPDWIPKGVPAPVPHPNYSPPPVAGLPAAAPSDSPSSTGAPAPNAAGNPNKSPFSFSPDGTLTIVSPGSPLTTGNPKTNPADQSFPGSLQPNPLTANPLSPGSNFSNSPSPDTGTPSGMPITIINQPTPDAYRETPVVSAPTPTPTPTPLAPTNQPDFDDLKKRFDEQALLLVGLTALLNPIANNTAPEKIKDLVQTATCQNVQPGGCMSPMAQNADDAARFSADNNNKLNALLQGLDLSLLGVINNKLGPQLPGPNGISGFLSRTAQAAKLDKVLNALNTILLLHNAAMLSRSLGSTLGDLTSQALATIGIKDSEGSPIDINEQLGLQANSFMESILGAEVWAGTKTSWNKASTIISTTTNIMNTVRSIFDSTREILEWSAENTGKIGNALKRFRVVGENAYKWMPERVTVQNRFTQKIDRIREGTDSLDDAASSLSGVLGEVQSIQEEYKDLQEQKQKFDQNIKELTPKTREDNKPVADAVTAAIAVSKAPTNTENVFRGEGENNA